MSQGREQGQGREREVCIAVAGDLVWFAGGTQRQHGAPRRLIHGEFAVVLKSADGGCESADGTHYSTRESAEAGMAEVLRRVMLDGMRTEATSTEDNHSGEPTTAVVE